MNNKDSILDNYNYNLPKELIAQYPSKNRQDSKLLVYNVKTDKIIDDHFYNLDHYLPQNSNLVLNNTKVFSSRLLGHKSTGGKAEMLLLSPTPDQNALFEVMLKSSGKKNIGDHFYFQENVKIEIIKKLDKTFKVKFLDFKLNIDYLQKNALIPIPPYIRNGISTDFDKVRYQTIYAKDLGAVAAPTAGLHFSEELFKKLGGKSISKQFVTLNVGPGTFAPVKESDITIHKMHSENYFVSKDVIKEINRDKLLFAVGTTSLRVLASIYCQNKKMFEFNSQNFKSTEIFLYPPTKINYIDGLLTNFHLPKSTLLMLVSCLTGREKLLEIYQHAIKNNYRFYSYGDSMLILC